MAKRKYLLDSGERSSPDGKPVLMCPTCMLMGVNSFHFDKCLSGLVLPESDERGKAVVTMLAAMPALLDAKAAHDEAAQLIKLAIRDIKSALPGWGQTPTLNRACVQWLGRALTVLGVKEEGSDMVCSALT